jgi:hypothetical protein
MQKIIKQIEWIFDYHFAWMFYNGYKTHRYVDYMCEKYPGKFEDCVDRKYRSLIED